jgi:hypothetical protein
MSNKFINRTERSDASYQNKYPGLEKINCECRNEMVLLINTIRTLPVFFKYRCFFTSILLLLIQQLPSLLLPPENNGCIFLHVGTEANFITLVPVFYNYQTGIGWNAA